MPAFPPSPPWSDSEAEAFRTYLASPAGQRVLSQLDAVKPTAAGLIRSRRVSADIALGMLAGFDAALGALVALTTPPSTVKPRDEAGETKSGTNYPPLDDDAAWAEKVP